MTPFLPAPPAHPLPGVPGTVGGLQTCICSTISTCRWVPATTPACMPLHTSRDLHRACTSLPAVGGPAAACLRAAWGGHCLGTWGTTWVPAWLPATLPAVTTGLQLGLGADSDACSQNLMHHLRGMGLVSWGAVISAVPFYHLEHHRSLPGMPHWVPCHLVLGHSATHDACTVGITCLPPPGTSAPTAESGCLFPTCRHCLLLVLLYRFCAGTCLPPAGSLPFLSPFHRQEGCTCLPTCGLPVHWVGNTCFTFSSACRCLP